MVATFLQRTRILRIREHQELAEEAAGWFHEKWQSIPKEVYLESIESCLRQEGTVPQWYIVMAGQRIVGGLGVIENDFHHRKDLTPNICAVYVEEDCRKQGIAGEMLRFVCRDMASMGIKTLYLITDHTSFYERYGWEFYDMVLEDSGGQARMYIHRMG